MDEYELLFHRVIQFAQKRYVGSGDGVVWLAGADGQTGGRLFRL